jgi:hypothetical protein
LINFQNGYIYYVADRAERDTPILIEHHLLGISQPTEAIYIQPSAVADHLGGKIVALVDILHNIPVSHGSSTQSDNI